MKKIPNPRLFLFGSLFLAVIVFDFIKVLVVGKPTIVNWDASWPTIVHPLWVLTAITVIFVSALFPRVQQVAFFVYLIIFLASLLNVYLSFTEVLSYWCMIFNLVLVSVFFFSQAQAKAEPSPAVTHG